MTQTAQKIEDLTLSIAQEIHVRATLDATFAALLEQLGPGNETMDGKPLSMKIRRGPAEGGTATWAITTATSGRMCKPSSGRPFWNSAAHCLRRIRLFRTCNTG